MPRLTLFQGRKKLDVINTTKNRILIGRHPEADVVLANPMISRRHAEIKREGARYVIANLQSKNGIFVNERWVEFHVLVHGDLIDVGKYTVKFEIPDDEKMQLLKEHRRVRGAGLAVSSTEMLQEVGIKDLKDISADPHRGSGASSRIKIQIDAAKDTFTLSREELEKVRDSSSRIRDAHLREFSVPPVVHPLGRKRITFGKSSECNIKIKTGMLGPKISAAIQYQRGKGHFLEVIGGAVQVGGKRVTQRWYLLEDGEIVEIGANKFQFFAPMK